MTVKKYSKNNIPRRNYNYGTEGDLRLITATGGTESTVGAYKIHTFTSNGTFTITQGSYQEIDYFAIAGGGPAGRNTDANGSGGGGAGGALMHWVGLNATDLYPFKFSQCIGPEMYTQSGDVWTVNVGLGGTALDNNSSNNSGGDTWILKNGAEQLRCYGGGGGGGAGNTGGSGVASTSGGNGGIGKAFSISGTSTYYGGGGGGGKSTVGGVNSTGGLGGGANGFNGTATTTASGTVNTGGGGGGGYSATTGGQGGSGIVILRYPDSYPPATSTTGTPTANASGGWRTYTFTQSGSITFG